MKRFQLIALMLIVLSLPACSSLRIGYYFADWYLESVIDDYFDLNSEQESRLEVMLDQIHLWHKTEEIPKLIKVLKTFRSRVTININPDDIFWIQIEIDEMKKRWISKVSKDVSILLARLSPDQIEHFTEVSREHHQEHLEENNISDAAWRKKQTEDLFEMLTDWFGQFSSTQKEALLKVYENDRQAYINHLEENWVFQKEFIALLMQKLPPVELEAALVKWLSQFGDETPGSSRTFNAGPENKSVRFFMKLDQIITTKQRQFFLSKIDDYIVDLIAIQSNHDAL